jgi:hypothetical protein
LIGISQRKKEGRSQARRRLCPDATAMSMNDSFHNCQANPGTAKLPFAVQALKRIEQLFGVLRIESSAVIANEKYRLPFLNFDANLDPWAGRPATELPRIVEQITDRKPQHRQIAATPHIVGQDAIHFVSGIRFGNANNHVTHQSG